MAVAATRAAAATADASISILRRLGAEDVGAHVYIGDIGSRVLALIGREGGDGGRVQGDSEKDVLELHFGLG